eukprot:scaffold18141_cov48-Phaeocystis_antarctica.AAC.5
MPPAFGVLVNSHLGRNQAGSDLGQLALRRPLSAPDRAPGRPRASASLNQSAPCGQAGRPYRSCALDMGAHPSEAKRAHASYTSGTGWGQGHAQVTEASTHLLAVGGAGGVRVARVVQLALLLLRAVVMGQLDAARRAHAVAPLLLRRAGDGGRVDRRNEVD